MLQPGEALARVLATMAPADRRHFVDYVEARAAASGDAETLAEVWAYRARLARNGGPGPTRPRPALRLVKDD